MRIKLKKARRERRLQAVYDRLLELRAVDEWEKVLKNLSRFERWRPGKDSKQLRLWAEQQRDCHFSYERARLAFEDQKWANTIAELEQVIAKMCDKPEASVLLVEARARQHNDQEASQIAIEQAQIQIDAGNFTEGLNLLEKLLQQFSTNREATTLVATLIEQRSTPLDQRRRAAHLVGQAGDPRAGVCELKPAWCGPVPERFYPVGPIGQDGKQTMLQLETFRIARYPATVWQFRQFYEAGGYQNEEWWTKEGWKWRTVKAINISNKWDSPNLTTPNQPVVGVSWYEVVAFCRWITKFLQEALFIRDDEEIRLPSEAEWEVAATWDLNEECPRQWQPPREEAWQNVEAAGIGSTSPVGVFPFPDATSPNIPLDMAGNVWEWCASPYIKAEDQQAAIQPAVQTAGRFWGDFRISSDTEEGLPEDEPTPIRRGGSYHSTNNRPGWEWEVRATSGPDDRADDFGFRLCLSKKLTSVRLPSDPPAVPAESEGQSSSEPVLDPHTSVLEPGRAAVPLTVEQQYRLEQKRAMLREEWDTRHKKVKRLRLGLAIESDIATRFKLEQQLEEQEKELAVCEQQIDEFDRQLLS
ncbi:MAG: SUMF1/EgtB/PvdO family nonheme iron enzyme [Kouleothrix sp.]|nr:SUMF1/EgtB/PvdO family nonheme iron enzyme [Kouleothrix sp.]